MAGGIDLSAQDLSDLRKAVCAGSADDQTGVHTQLRIVDEVHLHGVAGIEEHHRFPEAGLLYACQNFSFGTAQLKVTLSGGSLMARHISGKIAALASYPGYYHYRYITVAFKGTAALFLNCGPVCFVQLPVRVDPSAALPQPFVCAGIVVPYGAVDPEACVFQGTFQCQIRIIAFLDGGGAGAGGEPVHRSLSEQSHPFSFRQRQGILVFQKNSAFIHHGFYKFLQITQEQLLISVGAGEQIL